jgi:hypothetical protein
MWVDLREMGFCSGQNVNGKSRSDWLHTLILNHLASRLELLQRDLGLVWEDQDVPVLVPHLEMLSRFTALLRIK